MLSILIIIRKDNVATAYNSIKKGGTRPPVFQNLEGDTSDAQILDRDKTPCWDTLHRGGKLL